MSNDKFLFFAGVDWGRQYHQICVMNQKGEVLGQKAFAHGGAGLGKMAQWATNLCKAGSEAIAVGIEVPRGPVVESLLRKGFCVFSANPKQVDRFRDRFGPAGAKDDRKDALVLASALRTDGQHFRSLDQENPDIVILRGFSRTREELVKERTRLINQLRDLLWGYFPQFDKIIGDKLRPWHLELFLRTPSPAAAGRIRVSTVRDILKNHRIRKMDAQTVLDILRAEELDISEATATSCVTQAKMVVERLKFIGGTIKELEASIQETVDTINSKQKTEDGKPTMIDILLSVPGVGPNTLAALLSEAWGLLCDRDYNALRCLGGTAPVTMQSGKIKYVVRRMAAQGRLREALHVIGGIAAVRDPVSKAKYEALKARGLGYNRCVRTVADRILRVICALLKKGELFDKEFKKPLQDVDVG